MSTSTLKGPIIAAFVNVWLPAAGGGVTVVNGSNSTQGVVNDNIAVEMGDEMDVQTGGIVRVQQDEIGTLKADQTITVGGKRVFVRDIDIDKAGALVRITYTEARPVE